MPCLVWTRTSASSGQQPLRPAAQRHDRLRPAEALAGRRHGGHVRAVQVDLGHLALGGNGRAGPLGQQAQRRHAGARPHEAGVALEEGALRQPELREARADGRPVLQVVDLRADGPAHRR